MLDAGGGDLGAVEVQILKLCHPYQMHQSCICDLDVAEVQALKLREHFQVRQSTLRALEESFQPLDAAEAAATTASVLSVGASAPSASSGTDKPASSAAAKPATSSVLLDSRAAGGWRPLTSLRASRMTATLLLTTPAAPPQAAAAGMEWQVAAAKARVP